jgi:hypothetical protein
MFMEGKHDYTPANDAMGERLHLVGSGTHPVYVCKKKDVPGLFNQRFWSILEIWQFFDAGFGLPGNKTWDESDPFLMKCLLQMSNHFKHNFSQMHYIMELLQQRS